MPSTVIRSNRYDRGRRTLDIVFQSGRRHTYLGLPQKTYGAMKAAISKGEFFNRHIRDRFGFERDGEELAAADSRRAEFET